MIKQRKKRTMTREEHLHIGKNLQIALEMLLEAYFCTSKGYGKTSKEFRRANRAVEAVRELRTLLDDNICNETPLDDPFNPTHAYYNSK